MTSLFLSLSLSRRCGEKCEELEQLHLIIKQLENIYIYIYSSDGRKGSTSRLPVFGSMLKLVLDMWAGGGGDMNFDSEPSGPILS